MQKTEFDRYTKLCRLKIIAFFPADALTILTGLAKIYAHHTFFFLNQKIGKTQECMVSCMKYKV